MNAFTSFLKTVAATGTPEQLGPGARRGSQFVLTGYKDAVRTENVGDVWVQTSSTNNQTGIKIVPGGSFVFSAPLMDDSDFWIDVETAGDGVYVFVLP